MKSDHPLAKWLWILALLALIMSACSVDTSVDQTSLSENAQSEAPQETASDEPTPAPPASSPPAASPPAGTPVEETPGVETPDPLTPDPDTAGPSAPPASGTPEPPTVVDDGTPVIVQSPDGWVLTQGEIDELSAFIEEFHQLSFTAPIVVQVNRDIGAVLASEFEIFSERDWNLMRALGLDDEQDRDQANQVRRDRIRGMCCEFKQPTTVDIEIQPTKLATEMLVVHELTHALHTQHNELFVGASFETTESPAPYAAAIEGIPQFVAFEYMSRAPQQLQDEVTADLPIITEDMLDLIAVGPARFLNFAYETGPAFVSTVVEARGIDGLAELLGNPPSTTEQVLFPEKYLAGEGAGPVPTPPVPAGADEQTRGTIGAAMLMFLLTDAEGEAKAKQLVKAWTADSYVVFDLGDQRCLTANLVMDNAGVNVLIGEALRETLRSQIPDADVVITPELITINTCALPG